MQQQSARYGWCKVLIAYLYYVQASRMPRNLGREERRSGELRHVTRVTAHALTLVDAWDPAPKKFEHI